MPRLSDETRERRRQHILASAWTCFSRDGFQATSMDQVIAATGMSSAAVYRYFRSKEEIIHASAVEGVSKVAGIFTTLLERDPCPSPTQTLDLLSAELRARTDNPDYDMTRIALQAWAETLRDPVLHKLVQEQYRSAIGRAAELARRWRDGGHISADAEPEAVAVTLFTLMHGLIVIRHTFGDIGFDTLRAGLTTLGATV